MTFQKISIPTLVTCILILIVPGTGESIGAPDIEFFQERVEIEVSESSAGEYDVHVRGYYYFRNPTPFSAERKLFYPFPDFEGASYPGEIRVVRYSDLVEDEPVPVQTLKRGITFAVGIAPSSTVLIRVDYTQHTEVGRGVYVTTTTSAWKKPLELAEFIVSLPTSLCLTGISYPVHRVKKDDDWITVDIRFQDFMPKEDLILRWKSGSEIRTAIP